MRGTCCRAESLPRKGRTTASKDKVDRTEVQIKGCHGERVEELIAGEVVDGNSK